MTPSRREDLESVRFVMVACKKDIETILNESGKETGKMPRALAISYKYLDQAVLAINAFLREQPTVLQVNDKPVVTTEPELNSGTDS
jgi:hypothetical protein